ncbi:MAG: hypothetical protein EP344_09750 [Bacteroidetes bacterium]|nr:MAG: hypothetical protein EP344_09750 [Bacteroidota bacterium]
MKRLIVNVVLILFGASLWAQPGQVNREERLQSYRIAIFTEVLQLTTEEAQGFWPVYNEYQDKRDQMQNKLKPAKQLDAMSDSEVEEQIKRYLDSRQSELDLEKELVQKLRGVLPTRKIAKLPNAERIFRERLLTKLQEARAKRQQRAPGRN